MPNWCRASARSPVSIGATRTSRSWRCQSDDSMSASRAVRECTPKRDPLDDTNMQLTEHRNERQLFVRKADASSVVIIDREYTRSLALSAAQVIENLRVRRVEDLD